MKKILILALLIFLGCSDSKLEEREKKEIEKMFERYFKFLSLAYSKDDPSILWPVASEHEIEQTRRTMANMWGQGYHIEPYLKEFKITYLDVYQIYNAFAKTKEIWIVSYYDFKTRERKEDNPNMELNVIYQLKKIDGIWKVTSRVPQETMIKVIP